MACITMVAVSKPVVALRRFDLGIVFTVVKETTCRGKRPT